VAIVADGDFGKRAILLAPVGQQFIQRARIDHRARKDMRADLAALFQHADREIGLELFQPDRGGEPGRPTPTITTSYSIASRIAVPPITAWRSIRALR
jgi:hypothetical protein